MDLLILIVLILTGVDLTAEGGAPTTPTTDDGGDNVRKSPIG
jgi:hypothetical protein